MEAPGARAQPQSYAIVASNDYKISFSGWYARPKAWATISRTVPMIIFDPPVFTAPLQSTVCSGDFSRLPETAKVVTTNLDF
jgi:hypothetical protein